MKTYYEKNNTRVGYRPITRRLNIYSGKDGNYYFNFRGRRVYFNDTPYLTYPIMPEDEDGKLIVLGLYMQLTNLLFLLIELDTDNEYVRVWEQIEKEDE